MSFPWPICPRDVSVISQRGAGRCHLQCTGLCLAWRIAPFLHEIAFTLEFDQHTDFTIRVNVDPIYPRTWRVPLFSPLLMRLFAQVINCLFESPMVSCKPSCSPSFRGRFSPADPLPVLLIFPSISPTPSYFMHKK